MSDRLRYYRQFCGAILVLLAVTACSTSIKETPAKRKVANANKCLSDGSTFYDRITVTVIPPDLLSDSMRATINFKSLSEVDATTIANFDSKGLPSPFSSSLWATDLDETVHADLVVDIVGARQSTWQLRLEDYCEGGEVKVDLRRFVSAVQIKADLNTMNDLIIFSIRDHESGFQSKLSRNQLLTKLYVFATEVDSFASSIKLDFTHLQGGSRNKGTIELDLPTGLIFKLDFQSGKIGLAPVN